MFCVLMYDECHTFPLLPELRWFAFQEQIHEGVCAVLGCCKVLGQDSDEFQFACRYFQNLCQTEICSSFWMAVVSGGYAAQISFGGSISSSVRSMFEYEFSMFEDVLSTFEELVVCHLVGWDTFRYRLYTAWWERVLVTISRWWYKSSTRTRLHGEGER